MDLILLLPYRTGEISDLLPYALLLKFSNSNIAIYSSWPCASYATCYCCVHKKHRSKVNVKKREKWSIS